MIKNPPRLEQIFERGFELRGTAGYVYERMPLDNLWHTEPAPCLDGVVRHHWHASSLAGCPRAQILKRAAMPSDGRPLNSEITFNFGHSLHSLLEEFTSATFNEIPLPNIVFPGRLKHVGSETGGCLHPTMDLPLKARADWVFVCDDAVVIQDLKSEGTHIYRIDKAKADGAKDSAKKEHKLQIACNAIIQEGLGLVPDKVKYGAVTYCSKLSTKDREGRAYSKNEWKWDTQWFEITEQMREEVLSRIENLNSAWDTFQNAGVLPVRLLDEVMPWGTLSVNFLCRPRSADDDRGKYCEFRRSCYSLPNTSDTNIGDDD